MSKTVVTRLGILAVLILLAALIPLQVRAGGVCGGTYIVEKGDTVNSLATLCGTTAAAILAANPGLKEPLTVGQSIIIPGINFVLGTTTTPSATATPTATVTPTPTGAVYNTYNYYNYYNFPSPGYVTTYTVQAGDTFDGIAAKFNVPVYDLWMANSHIPNVQQLAVGQLIYIPFNYWGDAYPTPLAPVAGAEPKELTYPGNIPANAPRGLVELFNEARYEVYISFHITRADGTNAIYEYPVQRRAIVDIPTGWVDYVAWVGGVKYTGGFQLREDVLRTITFKRSRVVVE